LTLDYTLVVTNESLAVDGVAKIVVDYADPRLSSRSNTMSRTSLVSFITLIITCMQSTFAYDVYGQVNEPLHVDDSQVRLAREWSKTKQ